MAKRKKGSVPVIRLTSLKVPNTLQKTSPRVYRSIFFISAALLVVSLGVWWRVVWNNPRRVFERMLDTSLSTTSVTRHITQEQNSQKLDEYSQLLASDKHLAHSWTTIAQSGDAASNVITESIGTPIEDYARYVQLTTAQLGKDNKPIDFSQVINVWGKVASAGDDKTNGQLFNELTLGIIPFGNLPQTDRANLVKMMKDQNVYDVNYATGVTRKLVNGRPTYYYKVSVKPAPYVAILKQFAANIGLNQLDQVNPDQYKDSQPIEFEVAVDVRSSTLRTVSYSSSDRVESYVSYGAQSNVSVPKDTVSIDELQGRLQTLQ